MWNELRGRLGGRECQLAGGCDASCCNFKQRNREPDVTPNEIAEIRACLKRQGREMPNEHHEGYCHFLDSDLRCSIYEVRPTMCRIFYCDGNTDAQRLESSVMELVRDALTDPARIPISALKPKVVPNSFASGGEG